MGIGIGADDGYWFAWDDAAGTLEVMHYDRQVAEVKCADDCEAGELFDQIVAQDLRKSDSR